MILDRLENWALYFDQDSRVGRAMQWLSRRFDESSPDGRIDIDGEDIFALVQGYATLDPSECRFESHRRYLDIQYVYGGGEVMGWKPISALDVVEDYDADKDVAFFAVPPHFTTLEVYPGQFALFYPNDGHMPRLKLSGEENVKKVVVKVRV